ncbi:unnamed protein product [Mytilus coruscus]|uniref:Uncharacterized protein n=1 Tax=Mytilus coruscus TaxID=42192 RepID=A0A6J8A3A2_MYTCO|nr:unnamed protein product [Mytilus coruscus]
MKYHPACLVALYNKQIAVKKKTEEQTEIDIDAEHEVGDVALAELVNYIFQTQRNRYGATALRLSDLENTFERRVQQLKEIQSSVSPSLLELLCITEHGPDIQSQLENGVCHFTTATVDNIDHSHTLTLFTPKSSFHGTGISIFQHPSYYNGRIERRN